MDEQRSARGGADPWQDEAGTSLVRALRRWAVERGGHTALRFLERGERESDAATYAELDRDARTVAARLRAAGAAGRPVLVALPQGLDFLRCLVGCLYAGAIPVPTPAWDDPRATARIAAIMAQARPALVIALPRDGAAPSILVRPADLLQGTADPPPHDPAPADIALLQYTSGSTSRPKGVVITHGNIAANLEMIRRAFALDADGATISWLPLHHDMGLIGSVLEQLHLGATVGLMSPLAFLQRPARWLQALSALGTSTAGGPNFGYELCRRTVTDAQLRGLDLSRWRLAFCGAEPVRPATLTRFVERFAPAGFDAKAFYPCYGLAEATLFVTGGQPGAGATIIDGPDPGAPLAGASISCGTPRLDAAVALLEPDAPARVPEGSVGEIAIAGANVSPGFWDPDRGIVPDPDRLARLDGRTYLRTGDIGRLVAGNLHVVGRTRNMIVLHGANIHAEDVERTVADLPQAAALGTVAALPITDDGEEGFVLVCEAQRGTPSDAAADLLPAITAIVAEAHGAAPLQTLLVPPGTIARTLSGKLQRDATREAYRAGKLEILARHVAPRPRVGV